MTRLAELTDSPNVQQLWRNTRAAMKDYNAAVDPDRPTVRDLQERWTSVGALQNWFVRDRLTLEEFEGLLELLLEREALET